MQSNDVIHLEELCHKTKEKKWREYIHNITENKCIYCGEISESIDHLKPRSKGGITNLKNCVPSCLSCNALKSDYEVMKWYRKQVIYDPRRAMMIRAWILGDFELVSRLILWTKEKKYK